MHSMGQLLRLRWVVRTVLVLGVAASVAANVLHAKPNPISQVISAWPSLAFVLTVELVSRIPLHRRTLLVVRIAATAGIAGIAAWISYWHMASVAARYGETGSSTYLLPLTVDGLVVVASVCLIELSAKIGTLSTPPAPIAQAARVVDEAAAALPAPVSPAPVSVEPTAVPQPPQAATRPAGREPMDGGRARRGGRSGPQVMRPVKSPLNEGRTLLEAPPQP